ncbi:MAG TPA: polysaccharide deacetylase family protein [Flavobacteriales bacterium]|nr:polysaccharide deacetylase family protein [Flavobacteriales bacterium]
MIRPPALEDAAGHLLRLDGRMLWRVSTAREARTVHLTFDDGPDPEVTPWVLDTLGALGVKATFFCVGRNIQAHPAVFKRLRDEGHAIGNHTWDHGDAWRTQARAWYREVLACQQLTGTRLFRPPYGHLTNRAIAALRRRFQVVMWDVLAHDYEEGWTDQQRIALTVGRVRPGSIIVFHDSPKCAARMRASMPEVVRRLKTAGYRFDILPETLATSRR